MALDYGSGRQGPIKAHNLRVCGFYADWLQKNYNINTTGIPRQDAENFRQASKKLIAQRIQDKEEQHRLLSEMEKACSENIFPLEDFAWLQQDERATFWLWGYICCVYDKVLEFPLSSDVIYQPQPYHCLGLNESPSSHQERMDSIILFFDKITFSPTPVGNYKIWSLEGLKKTWKTIYSKPLPLKWLPNEDEAVLWAWNKLKQRQAENGSVLPGNYRIDILTAWFTPLSHDERHLALRAALDLWDNAPDSKQLFLLNLNKAWNQQKLRKSRIDKKALNTYLKNDTKTRLDLMAEQSGLRISDLLEKLINEHYRNTIGSK
jgi:hypothetical protein